MLISTRVRKSPFQHLSMKAGCWRAAVYNRIYHPRGYVRPEKGGAMVEYQAIKKHVTMWNSSRKTVRVKGPDAEKFTDATTKRTKFQQVVTLFFATTKAGFLMIRF